MAYGDFKDIPRRTAARRVLRDKVFNIAKNPKYDGYQRVLASNAGRVVKKEIIQNKELPEELHKPIIRKIEKRKVHS